MIPSALETQVTVSFPLWQENSLAEGVYLATLLKQHLYEQSDVSVLSESDRMLQSRCLSWSEDTEIRSHSQYGTVYVVAGGKKMPVGSSDWIYLIRACQHDNNWKCISAFCEILFSVYVCVFFCLFITLLIGRHWEVTVRNRASLHGTPALTTVLLGPPVKCHNIQVNVRRNTKPGFKLEHQQTGRKHNFVLKCVRNIDSLTF